MSFPITTGDAEPLPFRQEGGGLGYIPGQLWLDTSADPSADDPHMRLKAWHEGAWVDIGLDGAATRIAELYDRLDAAADILDDVEEEARNKAWLLSPPLLARLVLAGRLYRLP